MFIAKKYLSYFFCIKIKCFLAKFNTKPFSTFFDFYCFLETFPKILVITHFARVVIFCWNPCNLSERFHFSLHSYIEFIHVFKHISHVSKFSNPMTKPNVFKMFIQYNSCLFRFNKNSFTLLWSSNSLARTFPRESQRTEAQNSND